MAYVQLHNDVFTAADATNLDGRTMTDTIGAWTKINGTWEVHSNHGRETSGGSNRFIYDSVGTGYFDKQTVQVIAVSNLDIGPVCRFVNAAGSATGYLMYLHFSTGAVTLYRVDGTGSLTSLATGGTANANDVVLIEANGSTITCYINGSSVCSASDATYTTGVGGMYSGGLGNQEFDNWVVSVDSGASSAVGAPYYREFIARDSS